jgi:hypothetical protein
VKFLKMTGVFVVPLAYAFVARPVKAALSRWQPLPWAFLFYLLVLVAFVTHQFFLVGRSSACSTCSRCRPPPPGWPG